MREAPPLPASSSLVGLKPDFNHVPVRQLKLTAIPERNFFFFLFVS
jgi:hypothetical protein